MLCEVSRLSKSFPPPAGGEPILVLCELSLALDRGESVAVVGPSGSGKTTLLNCIATLDRPDSGSIIIDGVDVSGVDDAGLSELRNKKIGMVFQHHYLLPHLTLLENILIPTLPWPAPPNREPAEDRALRLAKRVGLENRLHHRPGSLSGGECQRGAVVRALINTPALLCADEPTGSLDRTSADALGDLLVELNREENTALIVVTHSERLAVRMGKRLQLSEGVLVEE